MPKLKHVPQTLRALLARELPLPLATKLAEAGHTLASLKQEGREALLKLGLSEASIELLHSESRPPIPEENLVQALYEARSMCCVCRDSTRPVIVHHIDPWHESRSHAPENLVVLCLHHHDEAHTKHELSLTLTPTRIRELKAKWLYEVQALDAAAITRRRFLSAVFWDYFNHTRLNDLVAADPALRQVHGNDLAPPTGTRNQYYVYEGDLGTMHRRRAAYSNLLLDIMRRDGFVSLNCLHRDDVAPALARGRMFALNTRFRFTQPRRAALTGPGQIRKAKATHCGITFKFTFDAWEATSTSAWGCHLMDGDTELLALLYVRSISTTAAQRQEVQATCLALGNGSDGMIWSPFLNEAPTLHLH